MAAHDRRSDPPVAVLTLSPRRQIRVSALDGDIDGGLEVRLYELLSQTSQTWFPTDHRVTIPWADLAQFLERIGRIDLGATSK